MPSTHGEGACGMDVTDMPRCRMLKKFSSHSLQQLVDLWPKLTWPHQTLPVLDVDCGMGDITAKFLAPRMPEGTKIVACGSYRKVLKLAKKRNPVPDVVAYQLFDVEEAAVEKTTVWQQGPYSKVFALTLLQGLPNIGQAIQNIHKLLVPGGEAIFNVIPEIIVWGPVPEVEGDPELDMKEDPMTFSTPAAPVDLRELLMGEGFQIVQTSWEPIHIPASLEDEVIEMIHSTLTIAEDWLSLDPYSGNYVPYGMLGQNSRCKKMNMKPCTSMVIVAKKL